MARPVETSNLPQSKLDVSEAAVQMKLEMDIFYHYEGQYYVNPVLCVCVIMRPSIVPYNSRYGCVMVSSFVRILTGFVADCLLRIEGEATSTCYCTIRALSETGFTRITE